MTTRALAALCLAAVLAAPPTRAWEWPVPRRAAARVDPLERLRWDRLGAWHVVATVEARNALARIDASGDDGAAAHGARATLHRLLRDEASARASLRAALARSPDGAALDDPDVALTAAWLAARGGDLAAAVSLGARATSRMPAMTPAVVSAREALTLELARVSMARGPAGLPDAERALRAFAAATAPSALVRATLCLVALRAGRGDDARELARPLRDLLQPGDGADAQLPRGALVTGDGAAAVGVALRLAGRPRDAVAPLAEAARAGPAAWRAFQAAQLAAARRGGSAP